MPKMVLRNQIRRLRFEHGEMTQKELAQRAGCTRQTIHLVELPLAMLAGARAYEGGA